MDTPDGPTPGDMIRAAIYTRVSTKGQVKDGLSLGEQEKRGRADAERRGWQVVAVFREEGVSGGVRLEDRPEGARMLAAHEAGEFDVLVVPDLSRLTRSTAELLSVPEQGIDLVSVRESIDTTTASGKAHFGMLGVFAEFEKNQTAERVKETTRARAAAGKHHGGPPPFGYDYHRDGDGEVIRDKPWKVVPAEKKIVERIYREYRDGKSGSAISRDLDADGVPTKDGGDWHPGTVGTILRSKKYIGLIEFGGEVFEGNFTAIIDQRLWDAVAARRADATTTKGHGGGRPAKVPFLFVKGKLRCRCGAAMVTRTDPNRQSAPSATYYCYGRKKDKASCDQKPLPRALVDGAAYRYFERVGLDVQQTKADMQTALDGKADELRTYLTTAERDQATARDRLARVKRDYQDERIDAEDWQEQRVELTDEVDAATAKVEQMTERLEQIEAGVDLRDVEGEALGALAEIREKISGTDPDAATVTAARAAIERLFAGFRLRASHEYLTGPSDLSVAAGLMIEPIVKPQALNTYDEIGHYELPLVFNKTPLSMPEKTNADALTT